MSLRDQYSDLYDRVLKPLEKRLESHVKGYFEDFPHVDRISVRSKSVDRFVQKSEKLNDDGVRKYTDPLNQIQDQIGARIVVYYLGDIPRASDIVTRYFHPIEAKVIVPDSESEFGYFGKHFILIVPTDVLDENQSDNPRFFELQIKTLFQHAWAEAEHDLGYKPEVVLDTEQKRRIAFTAAQAWGADKMFEELREATTATDRTG